MSDKVDIKEIWWCHRHQDTFWAKGDDVCQAGHAGQADECQPPDQVTVTSLKQHNADWGSMVSVDELWEGVGSPPVPEGKSLDDYRLYEALVLRHHPSPGYENGLVVFSFRKKDPVMEKIYEESEEEAKQLREKSQRKEDTE